MSGPRVERTCCPGRRRPVHTFVCVHCDHRDGVADALLPSGGLGHCRDVAGCFRCLSALRPRPETRTFASSSAGGAPERSRHAEVGAKMNRVATNSEAETAILLRMAESRTALLAANSTPPLVATEGGLTWPRTASTIASLADAPRVTLLLALCVGAIVLGPRRTIVIAIRSGITAWLGYTVRK